MGQKVHPRIFRIGVNKTWNSRWFTKSSFGKFLQQDEAIRQHIRRACKGGGIARIEIARTGNAITVTIATSRPGVIIGRGGAGAEELRKGVQTKVLRDPKAQVRVNIEEVNRPDLDAELVVQSVAEQIEKRLPFRRVLKQTVERVKRAGAQGVRVTVAGRLNGAEIARTETLHAGSIPLHTLRADIEYARGAAHTTYGSIGVKVWIYKGEVFHEKR